MSSPITISLQQEHAAAARLLDILLQEKDALLSHNVEAIEQSTRLKAEQAVQMQRAHGETLAALEAAGYHRSCDPIATWLTHFSPEDSLTQSWKSLIEIAQRIQTLNQENGVLIQALSVHNQAALSAMRIQKKTDVYGPSGYKTTSSGFRSVIA